MHRAHSSLVEYERGNRLAPVDVVRDYESALGLKADTLVALRNRAHARRAALGHDGDLPDAVRPAQAAAPRTGDGDPPDAARHAQTALTSESSSRRSRLWPLGLAALGGAVAVAIAIAALNVGFGGGDPADKATPSAPTQGSSSPAVTIGAPSRYEVQRCTQFSGTAAFVPG